MNLVDDTFRAEAKRHFEVIWPMIEALGRGDFDKLDDADDYLQGVLDTSGQPMHDLLILMIGRASGVSWEAIRHGGETP